MEINVPDACGNSPRLEIVRDFTLAWASGDESAAQLLKDSAVWTQAGSEIEHIGADGIAATKPANTPTSITIHTVINHGKTASSDGFYDSDAERVHFSHVFTFASAGKQAKIAQVRSYFVAPKDQ